jgi:hypothetical protein
VRAEFGFGFSGPGDQHLVHPDQRLRHRVVEGLVGVVVTAIAGVVAAGRCAAPVLQSVLASVAASGHVVAARFDALRFHMLAVKHQHMGFSAVDPDNGVVGGHGMPFSGCNSSIGGGV